MYIYATGLSIRMVNQTVQIKRDLIGFDGEKNSNRPPPSKYGNSSPPTLARQRGNGRESSLVQNNVDRSNE